MRNLRNKGEKNGYAKFDLIIFFLFISVCLKSVSWKWSIKKSLWICFSHLEATSQAIFNQISIKVSCHENFLFTKEMSPFVQTKMTEGT